MFGLNLFLTMRKMRLYWGLLVLLSMCFFAAQAHSQGSKEAQKSQDDVISLKAHLVTTDVMVKDKKGRLITNLKPEDFTIFENGVRQKVEFFDPPLTRGTETEMPKDMVQAQQKGTEPSSSVKSSGKPTNIISLVLDGMTTGLVNLKQVREGMLKYIREQITEKDTVAVFGVSTDLRLLQPFTQDKTKLIAAVEKAYLLTTSNRNSERNEINEQLTQLREELRGATGITDPQSPAAAAQGLAAARAMMTSRVYQQYVKLRGILSAQQARPVLAALAAICDAQQAVQGKKTLVIFSEGFVAPSILDWQVQSVIDIANRANVTIYIIDSAGLRTAAPQSTSIVPEGPLAGISGDLSTESRMTTAGGDSQFDNVRYEGLNREYDILYRISTGTGGAFLKGSNNLTKGLDRIDQEIHSRYTLAYYSTDSNFDGSFRKVKVEVRQPDTQVIARVGYFANASDEIVPLSPGDKKLLANFAAIEANPALPLAVEISPFRFKEGLYIVPMSIELPPSAMKFDRKGDKQNVKFEVLGVIREGSEKIIARLGGSFDISLSAEQYQGVLKNNIFFRQDMELASGTYNIELIVRDKLSGKMAAKRANLVLPSVNTEFEISGVVLSRYAEAAKKSSATEAAAGSGDVFSQGGVQIRPSPSREFRATDNLIIFFELYNAAMNAQINKPMVSVTVKLMKENKLAMKPFDYVLTETVSEPVAHLTFAKYIALTGLAPGKYVVVIEARDTVTRKLQTQQLPFTITQ